MKFTRALLFYTLLGVAIGFQPVHAVKILKKKSLRKRIQSEIDDIGWKNGIIAALVTGQNVVNRIVYSKHGLPIIVFIAGVGYALYKNTGKQSK